MLFLLSYDIQILWLALGLFNCQYITSDPHLMTVESGSDDEPYTTAEMSVTESIHTPADNTDSEEQATEESLLPWVKLSNSLTLLKCHRNDAIALASWGQEERAA